MKILRKLAGISLGLVLVLGVVSPIQAHADVNDLTVKSFEADYYLSRDAGKNSHLKITEKIVAEFPQFDQNHGIERAIPDEYDGHNVKLNIESVLDGAGTARQYTTYGSNNNLVLRIGDPDAYVRGEQTYVINYTLRDVTKSFDDHAQLYWDTNGTDWSQTFGSVTARLHLKGAVLEAYNSQTDCFVGIAGSTEKCAVTESKKTDETIVTFTSNRALQAGENMTLVAGFDKGSFAEYQPTAWERAFPIIMAIWLSLNGLVFVGAMVMLVRAWGKYGRAPKRRGTIVPEYIPPKDTSALVAAAILGKPAHAATAQIIDLAVKHYLKIYETETKGNWFRRKRTYELEVTRSFDKLSGEEQELAKAIFGDKVDIGERVTVELLQSKLSKQNPALQKYAKQKAQSAGYFIDRPEERKRYYWIGGVLLAAGVVLLMPGAFIAGIITFVAAASWRPLSEKGVAQRGYLQGLKMYMQLAEAERIQQLQSPTGAAHMNINPTDKKQLVKLYERLLPYAILFGMEKEWVKVFAPLYEQAPEWYGGNWAAFNGAAFASSLNNFSNVSNNAFSPPSSSSSSGFSGGGSSGGGGGGGGGGGW